MYFSASMLRSLAAQSYLPTPTVRLERFCDVTDARAELIGDHSGSITINGSGRGRLHFHMHGWSGPVSIYENGRLTSANLYAAEPAEQWIDFGSAPGIPFSIAILSLGERDPASRGDQIWLRGIEFQDPQPWQVQALPLSRYADFRVGRVGSLIVPHHDAVIGKVIVNNGAWAPKDLDLFEGLIRPGDVVFDIGANIGHHTVFFSDLVGPEGRVFAFEPQLEIFRFASANLVLNGCRNTTLMQGCLGSECGELRMAPISYDNTNNFGALSVAATYHAGAGETVPVWTLDSLIETGSIVVDRLDFMKIDVQSFELFVLQGAQATIDCFKPTIFLEIAPHWMKRKGFDYTRIYDLLKAAGYRFMHFDEGAGIEADIRQWSGQITEEWDVLCLPPDFTANTKV